MKFTKMIHDNVDYYYNIASVDSKTKDSLERRFKEFKQHLTMLHIANVGLHYAFESENWDVAIELFWKCFKEHIRILAILDGMRRFDNLRKEIVNDEGHIFIRSLELQYHAYYQLVILQPRNTWRCINASTTYSEWTSDVAISDVRVPTKR